MQHIKTTLDFSDLTGKQLFIRKGGTREVVIGLVGAGIVLLGTMGSISNHDFRGALPGLIFFAAMTLLALVTSYFTRPPKEIDYGVEEFAQRNGFSFTAELQGDVQESGTLFSRTENKKYRNVIAGEFHGLPHRLFQYLYSRNGRDKEQACILEFTLPRELPNIVIDSLMFTLGGTVLSSNDFAASQRLQLEGNFSQYFNLYVPKNYEVTALSVIAPDVMEVLLENTLACDVEVSGNKLYFYWQGFTTTRERFEQIYAAAQAVLDKVQRKLETGDIYTTPEQAAQSMQMSGPVASQLLAPRNTGKSVALLLLGWGIPMVLGAVVSVVLLMHAGTISVHSVQLVECGVIGAMIVAIAVMVIVGGRHQKKLLRELPDYTKRP